MTRDQERKIAKETRERRELMEEMKQVFPWDCADVLI